MDAAWVIVEGCRLTESSQYQKHLAQRLATKYEELDGHLRAVTSQADAEHARLEKQLNGGVASS